MFFAAGPVEAAIIDRAALGITDIPAEKQPMVGYGTYDQVVDVLDQHVAENEFMVGGRFSAADVYVGSPLSAALPMAAIPPARSRTARRPL